MQQFIPQIFHFLQHVSASIGHHQVLHFAKTDRSVATALPSTTPRPVPKSSADESESESRYRVNVPLVDR
jgi:hypothetical protein